MSTAELVYEAAPAAYLQQFDRIGSGPIWQKKLVTSDATGLNVATGPAIFGGMILVSATGVVANVFDGVTATGDPLVLPGLAATFIPGCGILCNLGITVDWTSGSWLVLYAAAG